MIAALTVVALQTIVSREIKPTEPAVITVGSIHAGTKHNIISDQCHLQLTVRSYSDEVRAKLLEGIKLKARAAAISPSLPGVADPPFRGGENANDDFAELGLAPIRDRDEISLFLRYTF